MPAETAATPTNFPVAPLLYLDRTVVGLRDLQQPDMVKYHIADHLRWMIEQEKQDRILLSGPFVTPGGVPGTSSLTIIRTGSLDEAWAIAEQDPFYRYELITFRIFEWKLMEGRVGLSFDLSDQRLSFA